ncbi:MAG: fructosamine kinase family protein [Sandaracinaceae bacterium]
MSALDTTLREALGPVAQRRAIAGGDVNEAWKVRLEDGRTVFVKTQPGAADSVFAREAEGLRWLGEAGSLRVPEVLAVGPTFLALAFVRSARPAPDHAEQLGRGLAALHRSGAAAFGGEHDNFIGRLPQDNTPEVDWATFYRERRLRPLVARAGDLLPAGALRRFEVLYTRLDELVGPTEPPARLHGDLWGGNAMVDDAGAPVLIDPAVYGGHREMDLAMMRLFGGFDERVFAAYREAWPLASGAGERVPLYQLYPQLVHVCMFGRGYVSGVVGALKSLTR